MLPSGCGGSSSVGDATNGAGGNGGGGVVTGTPLLDQYKNEMVSIGGQYKMGRTEVTVEMWREYCKNTGRQMMPEPSYGWKDRHPIVFVSWDDCIAYAQWAGLRLPSGPEWEFAAIGNDGRNYPWGGYGSQLPDNSWPGWDASKCVNDRNVTRNSPEVVGSIPSGNSPLGCCDMAGNVEEWTSTAANPLLKEFRGGSFYSGLNPQTFNYSYFRCRETGKAAPSFNAGNLGFRLAGDNG